MTVRPYKSLSESEQTSLRLARTRKLIERLETSSREKAWAWIHGIMLAAVYHDVLNRETINGDEITDTPSPRDVFDTTELAKWLDEQNSAAAVRS